MWTKGKPVQLRLFKRPDCMENPAEQLHLTVEQEMALYSAASSLFNLA